MAVNIADYVTKIYLREFFGGKEAKGTETLPGIEKRLDAYASTEDITTPAGIEKVHTKIETALNSGKFGDEVAITDFVNNYMQALTRRGTAQTELQKNRKDLWTLTNPSNVKRWLTEAQVQTDSTKAVTKLEEHIVDLSMARNKLDDFPTGSKLSDKLKERFNNAIGKIDETLVDMGSGKFSEEDLKRIMNGTYATLKLADANLIATGKHLEFVKQFEDPIKREDQYIKILQGIQESVTDYDDNLNLKTHELNYLTYSETVIPSEGGPSAAVQKGTNDLAMLTGFRASRLLGGHSQQYKDVFDLYKDLRKKHPKKMVYADFEDIMNKKVHNELYNYIDYSNNGNNNNTNVTGFKPHSPTNETNLINNMLKNRMITFTDDIFVPTGIGKDPKIWKQKGESIHGLGNPGVNTWKIKKDGINRDSKGNLISIDLEIPEPGSFALKHTLVARPGVYHRASVKLTPDNFIIEDDPYFSGAGYQNPAQGKTSYNILNNLYELIQ